MKTLIKILLLVAFTFGTAQAADKVFRAQFTTQISNREPVDNLKRLDSGFTSVYFFTEIINCVDCKLKHVWYLDGKKIYTYKSKVTYPRFRTWSKKTLTTNMLGNWKVKVKINGKTKVTREMTYFAPTATQVKQAPVQQRMQMQELDQCEKDLREISEKYVDEPNSLYYKFKFDKLKVRCFGE